MDIKVKDLGDAVNQLTAIENTIADIMNLLKLQKTTVTASLESKLKILSEVFYFQKPDQVEILDHVDIDLSKVSLKIQESLKNLIADAVEYANKMVYERAKENEELDGMGTTLEVCLIYNNRAYIGHVGDSRIYRIRNNIIRKLTTDHSYVEKLVKDGTITREEAASHPKKNMLTKALGCTELVEPDITVKGFLKDDIIVMTTDGLTNMVRDEEIYNEIRKDIENASNRLVEIANLNGGYDNITILIIINN